MVAIDMRPNNKRILVVEDEHSVARVLTLVLRNAGFEVEHVSSGGAAILSLDTGSHTAVLLDLGLPDRRGGDVVKRLAAPAPIGARKLVWIVLSAMDISDAESMYSVPRERFVNKPFDPWEIVSRLERELEAAIRVEDSNENHS